MPSKNQARSQSELEQFREEKDRFFKTSPHSPLTREQKRSFTGLPYFPENPDLRLEVPVEEFPEKETIEMQTSTGDTQAYVRFGRFHFNAGEQAVSLILYLSNGELFLPFVDSLAGKETYGAGRYLEPERLPGNRVLVDFNLAYNPYCAYNEMWSCPLTPFENRLKVPIRAGEKVWADESGHSG